MSTERDEVERTEAPSARWAAHVRENLPRPISRTLLIASSMLAAVITVKVTVVPLFASFRTMIATACATVTVRPENARFASNSCLAKSIWIAVPILAVPAIVTLFAGVVQTGGRLRFRELRPSLARFCGVGVLQQVATGSLARIGTIAAAKWIALTLCVAWWLAAEVRGTDGPASPASLGTYVEIPWRVAMKTAWLLVALGVADYLWAWKRHWEQMRMTRGELAAELRETEGDPINRRRIRQKLVNQSQVKWEKKIGKGDVVLVGTGRLAAAVRFEDNRAVLVSRGVGTIADSLERAARLAGARVLRHPQLARRIADGADAGSPLPPELTEQLFRTVAVS